MELYLILLHFSVTGNILLDIQYTATVFSKVWNDPGLRHRVHLLELMGKLFMIYLNPMDFTVFPKHRV